MQRKTILILLFLFVIFGQDYIHQAFEYAKPLYFETVYGSNYRMDASGIGMNLPGIVFPKTTRELIDNVRRYPKITVGGAMYSSGHQTLGKDAVLLDMRHYNNITHIDLRNKLVTVQSGSTWEHLIKHLDKYDMSVEIMQSYRDFSVGGSISVNVHGRYMDKKPIVQSVISLNLIKANGDIIYCSRESNPDIFFAVIGGYGMLGVIESATLNIVPNVKVELSSAQDLVAIEDYVQYHNKLLSDSSIILNNADLYAPDYKKVRVITWRKTDKPVTDTDRLCRKTYPNVIVQQLYYWFSDSHLGNNVKRLVEDYMFTPKVMWYNNVAATDLSSLTPLRYLWNRYMLQEFFIPEKNFTTFIKHMRGILKAFDVKVLNISIRYVKKDNETLLPWAKTDCFCVVMYYRQSSESESKPWSNKLINLALQSDGSFYLPYQRFATLDQLRKAYPKWDVFVNMKKILDKNGKFCSGFGHFYGLC